MSWRSLNEEQRQRISYWLPALVCGAMAWLTFVTLGQTPLIRASGLAIVIVGVALTLRRLGAVFALAGGLALAYCPAFWSQTGGGESAGPPAMVLALIAASLTAALAGWLAKRPYAGLGLALVVFAIIFWSQISTPRSLRLTSLLTAWLLYLLINALRLSHPRPEEDARARGKIDARYTVGLLLLLGVGVLNDPLFVLLAPAVVLGLFLSRICLPWWYWAIVGILVMAGVRGVFMQYITPYWWSYPAAEAQADGLRVPYILADGWRVAARWIELFELVIAQFSIAGVVLGMVGLARLARWYPVLGVVMMVAYAAYVVFGLVYFGRDRSVLLLPLLIIQVIWMTYAVYTFGQWLRKTLAARWQRIAWLAPAAFTAMPIVMLLRIANVL